MLHQFLSLSLFICFSRSVLDAISFILIHYCKCSIKHWRKFGGAPPEGVSGQAVGQAAAILRKANERRRGGFGARGIGGRGGLGRGRGGGPSGGGRFGGGGGGGNFAGGGGAAGFGRGMGPR